MHAVADLGRAVFLKAGQIGETARLARAQKPGTLQADVDERRLHAGQHTLHPSKHDIADNTVAGAAVRFLARTALFETDRAFEHQVLEPAILDNGHANFSGSCVNQDILCACGCSGNSDAKR